MKGRKRKIATSKLVVKKPPTTHKKERKIEKKEGKIYMAARTCETHILSKIEVIHEAEKTIEQKFQDFTIYKIDKKKAIIH